MSAISRSKTDEFQRPQTPTVIKSIPIQRIGDAFKDYTIAYPYNRAIPAPSAKPDPKRIPDMAKQKEADRTGLQFALVKFKGKKKSHPELNQRTKEQALQRANQLVALARQPGFRFKEIDKYSDIRPFGRFYNIVQAPQMSTFMRALL